jgi:hypothetical protein
VDGIAHNRGEGTPAPGFGVRPAFGLARDQGKRIEISFALKNGAMLTAVEELDEDLSADVLANFGEQLAGDIAGSRRRTFRDGWGASGQYVWVDLSEVAAFSLRPAK